MTVDLRMCGLDLVLMLVLVSDNEKSSDQRARTLIWYICERLAMQGRRSIGPNAKIRRGTA